MRKLKKFLLFSNLIFIFKLYSGFEFNNFSANLLGKGDAGVIDYNIASIYYNPANFLKEKFVFNFSIVNNYSIENFYTRSLGANFLLKEKFNLGYLFIIKSPFIYYNESLHLIRMSLKPSKFLYSGVNLKFYKSFSFLSEEYESDKNLKEYSGENLDIGFIINFSKILKIGVSFVNILKDENLEPKVFLGLQLFFSENGYFNIANGFNSKKWDNILENSKLYLGLEERVFEFLILRAGLNDFNFTAGFGLEFKNFLLNYGFFYHTIGISNSIDLNIRI